MKDERTVEKRIVAVCPRSREVEDLHSEPGFVPVSDPVSEKHKTKHDGRYRDSKKDGRRRLA